MSELKRTVLPMLMGIVAALCVACQPTPAEPVVAGKNDGLMENAVASSAPEMTQAEPYDRPERLDFEMDGLPEGYRIVFKAAVDVSDQTAWPVYTVEPADITQEQADTIRTALTGGTVLYRPGEYRSREEIQRSINGYENQLKVSAEEGYPELVEDYTETLKELYQEYERTPEDLVLEEADTELKFMESRAMPELYGGKEVIIDENSMRYEWTDEARQRAIDDGCESIYGIFWTDTGRKMEFSANNGKFGSGVGYGVADGNLAKAPGVSCSLEEATEQADALLKQAGLDFTLVHAKTFNDMGYNEEDEYVDNGPAYHALRYKRSLEGVPQDDIVSGVDQGIDDEYLQSMQGAFRPEIPQQEIIDIQIDDEGIRSFQWSTPIRVVTQDNASVALMPFEEVRSRIEQQLKAQTLWDLDEYESEYIDARRLEIYKLKLSYVMIAKKDDMDSCYLAPVWNVCGDMYDHYLDTYPTGESNTYILDENNERNTSRMPMEMDRDLSILTLNAIDGSVIPRFRWY